MAGSPADTQAWLSTRPPAIPPPLRWRSTHSDDNRTPVLRRLADLSGCQDDRKCNLLQCWSVSWLISMIVNLAAMVMAALVFGPARQEGGPPILIAGFAVEAEELEAVTGPVDSAPGEMVISWQPRASRGLQSAEIAVDLPAGGVWVGPSPGLGCMTEGLEEPLHDWAEYFGTVAEGSRFVYILDMSDSMTGGSKRIAPPDSRFARARYELIRSVDRLRDYQTFYVILFSHKTVLMFNETSYQPEFIAATPENKDRLQRWLDRVKIGGHTDLSVALAIALSMEPDAIFLLSDGSFSMEIPAEFKFPGIRPDVKEIVERRNQANAPIHTFAYEVPESKENMEILARMTGGEYKYLRPADGGRTEQHKQTIRTR